MPRKITPAQVNEWVKDFDAGKSSTSIAHAYKKDPRTVEGHIEAALRQRDLDHSKRQMLSEALRRHQEDLESVLRDLLNVLGPAELSVDGLGMYDGYRLPVPSPWASGNAPGREVKLEFKDKRQWELLRQHLPKDDLWPRLARWEADVTAVLEARETFWQKAISEGEKRTLLKLAPDGPEPHLGFGFLKGVADAVLRPLQGRPVEVMDRKRFRTEQDGIVRYEGDSSLRLARPKKQPESVIDAFLSARTEATSWTEAERVRSAYASLQGSTALLKRTAEDILLLHFIAGRCDICERLGGKV